MIKAFISRLQDRRSSRRLDRAIRDLLKKDPKFASKVDELVLACSVEPNPIESFRIGMMDLWFSHCGDKDE